MEKLPIFECTECLIPVYEGEEIKCKCGWKGHKRCAEHSHFECAEKKLEELEKEKNESHRLACELGDQLEETQNKLHAVILENKAFKKAILTGDKALKSKVRKLKEKIEKSNSCEKVIVPMSKYRNFVCSLSSFIGGDGERVPVELFCSVTEQITKWANRNGKKIYLQEEN